MPGKRKRADEAISGAVANGSSLSAIAAARLRAGAAAKGITTTEITHEPVPGPSSPTPQSVQPISSLPDSEDEEEEGEGEEEAPAIFKRKFKFCTWRNHSQDILSDTDAELTVNLIKHTTISLIGSFKFKVLRGAVNINGANIAAVSRAGQENGFHHAFVPATHPILKIRGLDGTNHVQFMSCKDTASFARDSPPFVDISNATHATRSFRIVSQCSTIQ